MSPEKQFSEVQKYKLQEYRKTNQRNNKTQITEIPNTNYKKNKNTEIPITKIHKYKLQRYRNTNYRIKKNSNCRITEIQIKQKITNNSKVTQS